MKKETHPAYNDVNVQCSCGSKFKVRSTGKDIHLDVCSECHPFYTGKQKMVDTAGRVEGFKQKYAFLSSTMVKTAAEKSEETGKGA